MISARGAQEGKGAFMRKKLIKVIAVVLCAAVLAALLLSFSYCGGPRDGVYVSEYGSRYLISDDELSRLDVAVELSLGEERHEFTVEVVYTYELYVLDFERRIRTRLSHLVYEGENQAVKNLIASFNRDVESGGEGSYDFANLTLKASTDSAFERGVGTLRINGELLRRKKS